jgi:photosystem II stability/assembly factor-like uncharacterized protein
MSKSMQFHVVLFSILLSGSISLDAYADQDLDINYAEHMPLATESVLLDITLAGETLVAVGERGHIIRSTDGENWSQVEVVPTRTTLTSVFSVGNRLWAGGHDAVIITSGDGGETWTLQFFDPDRQQAVMDIYFTDENNGVAIGSYGLILTTHDGGQTWDDALVDQENDFHLNNLVHFSDGRRMIAGEAGYSYRSFDNGETWEAIEMPYQGSMWGALKTDEKCVLFYGLRGHVMESCDFGSSWTELETGSEASISGAAKQDGLVLLAANGGTVLTREAGGQFIVHHHSSGVDFAAVISMGNGNFLLVGEDGVHKYPESSDMGEGND